MERFDAELYLRLRGEEMLLSGGDRNRGPWGSPLNEPASALLAVGAITAARARAVTGDYMLAEGLRSEHGAMYRGFGRQTPLARPTGEAARATAGGCLRAVDRERAGGAATSIT